MKQSRTITNESGKTIKLMIDPATTLQHIHNEVEWYVSESQWKRLVRESNNTLWRTEKGAIVKFTCFPHAADCKYPGRK